MERHPSASIILTATNGVMAIPNRLKQWVTPCTVPRSDLGNQNCITRVAVGNPPASPRPNTKRMPTREAMPEATEVDAVIKDQKGTMTRNTIRGPKRSAHHSAGLWHPSVLGRYQRLPASSNTFEEMKGSRLTSVRHTRALQSLRQALYRFMNKLSLHPAPIHVSP